MEESTLEWKYWDHVNDCWQYIDLDDLYGEPADLIQRDEFDRPLTYPRPQSQATAWPNLSIVDLLDSDHLKNATSKTSLLPNVDEKGARWEKEQKPDRAPSRLTTRSASVLNNHLAQSKLTQSDDSPDWQNTLRQSDKSRLLQFSKLKKHQSQVETRKSKSEEKSTKTNSFESSNKATWLVWDPRANVEPPAQPTNQKRMSSVSIMDHFPTSGLIHSPNPISQNSKRILKAREKRNELGYTVEPISGRGVRPPSQMETFKCDPLVDNGMRPETPVEIKRLRLLPTPVVRKCMAEALKNGILEPEDTDLIMNRIKNKVADCQSESDEEIIKNQSKRLISPLKYLRRPRREGGPIYKLDESKPIHPCGKTVSETAPVTFKMLSKTETVVPQHLEIPFLQKNKYSGRIPRTSKPWQDGLRATKAAGGLEKTQRLPKPIVNFELNQDLDSRDHCATHAPWAINARPMPPPPSPIKQMFFNSVI